mmetsp:Transcript_92454/g.297228  ORF Transcript_92454/g.297228 Transcript_92454/m.297228 type:complete len:382 (+) Transcript_92454:2052-3197(+)
MLLLEALVAHRQLRVGRVQLRHRSRSLDTLGAPGRAEGAADGLVMPHVRKLGLQLLDPLCQPRNLHVLRIDVRHDLVLDVLSSVRILQGVEGLREVHVGGRDASDHEGAAVAAEGVLQHARQLRISVGHVRAVQLRIPERRDHVAQGKEALVDAHALAEALADGAGLLRALGAREVCEANLRNNCLAAPCMQGLLEGHREDRVAARALLVHLRGGRGPQHRPFLETSEQLGRLAHLNLFHAQDHDALHRVLSDEHAAAAIHSRRPRVEEIVDVLVVEPHEAHAYRQVRVVLPGVNDVPEERGDEARDHAVLLLGQGRAVAAAQRVGLARGGLPVGQKRGVEALAEALDERPGGLVVDALLGCVRVEDQIEGEVGLAHGDLP